MRCSTLWSMSACVPTHVSWSRPVVMATFSLPYSAANLLNCAASTRGVLATVAIGSLYGVDIMNDNVLACRERLYRIWDEEYTAHCGADSSDEAREAARFIIQRNIINGNALTLMCVDAEGNDTKAPIVFSEWTLIGATQMQRSDYTMADLLLHRDTEDFPLFAALTEEEKEEGGIFLRRYITHYKKVQDYGEQ